MVGDNREQQPGRVGDQFWRDNHQLVAGADGTSRAHNIMPPYIQGNPGW